MISVKDVARAAIVVAAVCLSLVSVASAAVNIEAVPVANKGNTGEWSGGSYGGDGPDRICGAVDYDYRIGKYEVTAGQYTAFLNAVADTDTYELYNSNMWSQATGCKIQRTGSSGSWQYSVADAAADRPVNYVSWGDAARFANWLHNGQPTEVPQNDASTEEGAYFLNGATSAAALLDVTREAGWRWAIPTEDEWYKAAFYDPGKSGGAGYWDYATRADVQPVAEAPPGGSNSANHNSVLGTTTTVGAYGLSWGPYGTFDQNGNVWEWTEAIVYGSRRGIRGGSFESPSGNPDLEAAGRNGSDTPDFEHFSIGFRVATPEPATLSLLALGGAVLAARRRKV